jgi:hypothetical protein
MIVFKRKVWSWAQQDIYEEKLLILTLSHISHAGLYFLYYSILIVQLKEIYEEVKVHLLLIFAYPGEQLLLLCDIETEPL